MPKSNILAQIALAGIAAGLISTSKAMAVEVPPAKSAVAATSDSTTKPAPKPLAKATAKSKDSTKPKATPAMEDSSKKGTKADMSKGQKHSCKGMNECKGQGSCAMTQKDLDAAAKKMGVPVEKVGKAHSCKGMNECKGLGGCKMS